MAVFRPQSALFTRAVRDKKFEMNHAHFHDRHEIYYLVSGSTGYLVGDRLYMLGPGDLMFVKAGTIHKTTSDKPTERLLLMFDGEFFGSEYRDALDILFEKRHVKIKDSAAAELADVFARLEKEENRRERGYLELQRQYLRELVLLAQRNMLDAASLPLSNNYRLIEDAVSYIGQNYATDLSLSSVASEFGVSPAHFSRLFKSVVGIGFNEYLTDLRISHAEKLLLDKMSVSQTAFMCGFNDSNYFSAVFKKHKGITPKKLQMQKKGM